MTDTAARPKPLVRRPLRFVVPFTMVALGFFFVGIPDNRHLYEIPFHLLMGWALHPLSVVPTLLPRLSSAVGPLVGLFLSLWFIHRFINRFSRTGDHGIMWRPSHSVAVLALPLLGSAAAITLSGVAHQLVWLSQSQLVDRGNRDFERIMAMHSAKQLVLGMQEFAEEHRRYPGSIGELESALSPEARKLTWISPAEGRPSEPFVLLRPGASPANDPTVPVLASPTLPDPGVQIVGFADGSVRPLPLNRWLELQDGLIQKPRPTDRHE